jgi:tRNA A37 threonylcarbamoyltransferase TsaD
MVAERIGQVDASESGLISTSTSIRQYGLLRDPYKYGANAAVSTSNANTVISQTVNLTLVAGSEFALDEFVYQGGVANNAYFYGFVNSQTSNEVRLIKVRGDVAVGGLLIGATSGVTRTVVKRNNPEFQPYTGDIEYVENVTKIQRADGQAENIKFVIRF